MQTTLKVLLVDDDPDEQVYLEALLKPLGYGLVYAQTGERMKEALRSERPLAVFLDLHLTTESGFDLLHDLTANHSHLPVVMLTGSTETQNAVKAVREGAVDFITKPIQPQRLEALLWNLRRTYALMFPTPVGASEDSNRASFFGLTGKSPPMQALYASLESLAKAQCSVLIHGPTGSGKEVIAQTLHKASSRADFPFVGVNCAAIPKELMESELFGHERGAFTGAESQRPGLLEQAGQGVVFLDEIGELELGLQAKLLRVLQERRFRRVGGAKEITLQARVLAATNRDLLVEVAAGRFREDLYYRLNVVPVWAPALWQRRQDIPMLAQLFLEEAAQHNDLPAPVLSDALKRHLLQFSWPGNIRQLKNLMERLCVLSHGGVADLANLPPEYFLPANVLGDTLGEEAPWSDVQPAPAQVAVKAAPVNSVPAASPLNQPWPLTWDVLPLEELENQAYGHALKKSKGDVVKAAAKLGIGKSSLYRWLQKMELDPSAFSG